MWAETVIEIVEDIEDYACYGKIQNEERGMAFPLVLSTNPLGHFIAHFSTSLIP